jgi:hypothetical protein
VVYLNVVDVEDAPPSQRWDALSKVVTQMGAQRVASRDAWLLESDKSATELYLELGRGLALPHPDRLFVAEITTNAVGSYLLPRRVEYSIEADANVLAALIGKARRG